MNKDTIGEMEPALNGNSTVPKKTELEELEEMERIIHDGMETFCNVGNTLYEIRERKLYLLKNYKSFAAYCDEEFHLSKAHCYHLITHVKLCRVLGVSPADVPEKTLRSLSVIKDEEEQRHIWEMTKEENGGRCPSSRTVDKKVREHISRKNTESKSPVQSHSESQKIAEQTASVQFDIVTPEQLSMTSAGIRDDLEGDTLIQKIFNESLIVSPDTTEKAAVLAEQLNNLWNMIDVNHDKLSPAQKKQVKAEYMRRTSLYYDEAMS